MVAGACALGLSFGGYAPNVLELSGEASGAVYGLQNVFGTAAGIFVPLVASFFTTKWGDEAGFRAVFAVGLGLSTFASVVYAAFASSDLDQKLVLRALKVEGEGKGLETRLLTR